jgi:hypothetical protein
MIDYLKIEITPFSFAVEDSCVLRKLRIKIDSSDKPSFTRDLVLEPDELVSFFDQIWECAGKDILKHLKESKAPSTAPTQAPESPVEA